MDAEEQEELIGLTQEVALIINAFIDGDRPGCETSMKGVIAANWNHIPEQGEWI